MKSIANLVAIALRLYNEGYNPKGDLFEDLGEREGITQHDALVVNEPLRELIELEIIDGGSGAEGLQKADTRLIDVYRADSGFMEDPVFYHEIGTVKFFREQNIAPMFRRREK